MSKKALRKDFYMEIRRSLGRFLSIFFIVSIGVAFFSGIRSAEPDMRLSGDAYFDNKDLMDIKIMSSLGLTQEDVAALQKVKGIEKVEAGYATDALCSVNDSEKVVHIKSLLPTMNKVSVEEGRLPQAADECLVDGDFLKGSGYKIGDKLTFNSGTKADIKKNLKTETFTIVGTGSSPAYISHSRGSSTIGTGTISGFVYVPVSSFTMDAYTEMYARADKAKELTAFTQDYDKRISAVIKEVKKIRKERETAREQDIMRAAEQAIQPPSGDRAKAVRAKWYIYDRSVLPEYTGYGDNADRMKAIGQVFPVLFFLVAALISLTTMTRMVEEQRTLIGTFKALGYGRHSIVGKYIGYAFLATVGGSVLGVLAGEKILPYIIITAYGTLYPHMDVVRIPYNIYYGLFAVMAALACTLSATVFSCFHEMREQAASLMRPPTPKQGKRVFLERIPFLWKRLNFIWKATVRNLIRYKKRFFMTVFGIGGCMSLLLLGFGLKDSISDIAALQYTQIQHYDGNIILKDEASPQEKEEISRKLNNDSRVRDTAVNFLQQVEVSHGSRTKDVYLNVPKDVKEFSELVSFRNRRTHEKYKLDGAGAVLTEKMGKMLGAKVGDTIYIKDSVKGEIPVKIESICENYMGHYLYLSPDLYQQLYGKEPSYNSIYYSMQKESLGKLEKVGESVLETKGALSVSYISTMIQQLNDMLGSLNVVMIVLLISAGMLAFVVLYNLNNINITERKRELATLRVLGFFDKEVAAYVYRENIILTLIGGAAGIVMGILLHKYVIVTVEIDTAMFGRNIGFSSFAYSFLITLGFSFFVNGVMYFKLKKINMVESLKSIE